MAVTVVEKFRSRQGALTNEKRNAHITASVASFYCNHVFAGARIAICGGRLQRPPQSQAPGHCDQERVASWRRRVYGSRRGETARHAGLLPGGRIGESGT